MSHDVWAPDRYHRFRHERSQPFFELLALVRRRPALRAVDLGCGTGELTRLLHLELQAAATTGLDSSASMLAKSAGLAAPGLRFVQGDIGDWAPPEGAVDLVFSNAALHWLPDHAALLARLTRALAADGQLAVQIPANHTHPSHVVAAELAAAAPFRDALGGYTHAARQVLAPETYASLLAGLGYREQHVHLRVYGHWLDASADVAGWVEGTLLTDYERRLPPELWIRFRDRYRATLAARLGDVRPYFFAFNRILMWARLPA
jgi:trans-aconitate 2-methyltransferase